MALVRLATSGSVGWYKAWTLGEWSSPDPVALFELFSANAVPLGDVGRAKGPFRWINALAHRLRDNAPRKARENIAAHYDLGNDFYSRLARPDDDLFVGALRVAGRGLEDAQRRKVAHAARPARLEAGPAPARDRLRLGQPGDRRGEARGRGRRPDLVDASRKPGPKQKIAEAGLSDRIEIRLQDYRETAEQFDAVASVEMVEAVGERWWGAYLDSIARNLKPGGRAALQFISIDHRLFDRYARNADFIQTYIFPGGMLLDEPRFAALAASAACRGRSARAFGCDYAETLKRWRERYDEAVARGALAGFGEPFHDLWRYYLMYCEGGFRGGAIDVAQVTMVKE